MVVAFAETVATALTAVAVIRPSNMLRPETVAVSCTSAVVAALWVNTVLCSSSAVSTLPLSPAARCSTVLVSTLPPVPRQGQYSIAFRPSEDATGQALAVAKGPKALPWNEPGRPAAEAGATPAPRATARPASAPVTRVTSCRRAGAVTERTRVRVLGRIDVSRLR